MDRRTEDQTDGPTDVQENRRTDGKTTDGMIDIQSEVQAQLSNGGKCIILFS